MTLIKDLSRASTLESGDLIPIWDAENEDTRAISADDLALSIGSAVSVLRFGVTGNGVTDDTEAVRAAHEYANANNLPVSYAGAQSVAIQADADIQINTDVDFAGCSFVLLNGMDADPDYVSQAVLFRVKDDSTPYELTTLAKADCVLTKGSRVPFGVQQPGYYLLSCDYLIANRDKTGTSWYTQAFRIDEQGTAQFGLSADVSSCAAVTVRRRLNPLRRITIGGASFDPQQFNNQILFNIERNDVRLHGIALKNYATVPTGEDISALVQIDNAADVIVEDFRGPGRVVNVIGGLSQGTYCINPEGAANLIVRNVRISSYGSIMASNNVNGLFVDNCVINRVDVHTSGHNVFVRDSVLLNRGIGVGWGGGTISAHRVTVYDSPIVTDREDYAGCWFGGNIDVQDCEMAGDYWRNWFAVELCAFTRVATGAGVGSPRETFLPDSITVRNVVRKLPIPSGGNYVIGGVRCYTNASSSTLGKVYAPKHVFVENVRMEGTTDNYRFGNYLALREMWPNASGTAVITIADCPSYPVALTAFNANGKTLNTGAATGASANFPTQSQAARAKVKIRGCDYIAVECTVTGGEIDISGGNVQRVKCTSTDGTQRQSVRYRGVRFYVPILEGAETIGQANGYNTSAYFPMTLDDCVVIDAFDFSAATSVGDVQVRAGVTPTWPTNMQTVTPRMFGAAGDGTTDDTAAVAAAIAYADTAGLELDWGSATYRITSERDITFTGLMRWVSSGATILHDPASGTYSALRVRLRTGANYVKGPLTINANQKAHVCFRADPTDNSTQAPDLLIEDMTAINAYRASTSFQDGNGIRIVGNFGRVNLVRPIVRDVKMAVGAGVSGSQGVAGITVTRVTGGNYAPQITTIRDAWVENVWSEDAAYYDDQDGIVVFTPYGGTNTGGLNNFKTFEIANPRIVNSRNRSIKVQAENGRITGAKLYRTTAANNGTSGVIATATADIECQAGGVTISDVEFQYDNYSHARVVRVIQADETVVYASMPQVSNVRGVVKGASAPSLVCLFTANDGASLTQDYSVTVNGINVETETAIANAVSIGAGNTTSNNLVTVSNVVGKWGTALIALTTATSATVLVTNAIQRGSAVALVSGTTTTRRIFAAQCQGFTGVRLDYEGTGSPESVVTAVVGSTYRRTDGGAGTTLYVKESGTGNTGWVAK